MIQESDKFTIKEVFSIIKRCQLYGFINSQNPDGNKRIKYLQSKMKRLLLMILSLLFLSHQKSIKPYCSSNCIMYISACYDQTPVGCFACAISIYEMKPNTSLAQPCVLLPQYQIIIDELSNTAMDLSGYSSSRLIPHTCTNYTFSGQYVSTDYLSKNFTGIPFNHYALVVRFNVGFLGIWN